MRALSQAVTAVRGLSRLSWGHRVMLVGWWLFIAAFFIAPDKHALRTTFYVGVAVPALIWARLLIREAGWRDPLWIAICATLLFLSSSALWGADAAEAHALRAIKIMLVLLIGFLVPRALNRAGLLPIRALMVAIIVLAGAVAAVNLVENIYALVAGEQKFSLYMRLAGSGQYDNPLQYGGIMGCSALLALCEFFRATRLRSQIVLLLVLGLLVVSLVLTMSRGPILYFVAVSAVIAVVHRQRWRRSAALLVLASASALPFLLHPAGQAMFEANVERAGYRPAIWSAVMAEMEGKELFGQGWRDDQSVHTPEQRFGHPHNVLLGIYRFSGLLGLGMFIGLTALLLYRCARLEPDIALPLGAWLLYGICLHLTNGRFPVSAPGNDWFFFWLPAALVFACDRTARREARLEETFA